ncbi:MAG: NYN domain-containing protein [Ignavibacterium sp.]|nr:NYN domain-containing protein [Ignavibacterium sp.]
MKDQTERPIQNTIAVFIDFENLYYSSLNNYGEAPDLMIIRNLCEKKGGIASIQAFGDWVRFNEHINSLQTTGIQPVFTPLSRTEKSSADTFICVHAMKLFMQNENINTLILVSGDRDFIPLLTELRSLGKNTFLMGVPGSISRDLVNVVKHKESKSLQTPQKKVSSQIENSIISLLKKENRRVNVATIGIKIKKEHPTFNHKEFGYDKLSQFLDSFSQIKVEYDEDKLVAYASLVK